MSALLWFAAGAAVALAIAYREVIADNLNDLRTIRYSRPEYLTPLGRCIQFVAGGYLDPDADSRPPTERSE